MASQTTKTSSTKAQPTQPTQSNPSQNPKLCQVIMEQLETLPKKQEKQETSNLTFKQCPICMDDISPQTKNYAITPCGHEFCFSCLNTSLISNNTCPCCRHPLEKEKREKSNKINDTTSIELIKEAMSEFPLMDYIRTMDAFQEHGAAPEQRCSYLQSNINMMLRAYSLNLMEYVRNYQEIGDELFEDDEDYEEDDDEENEETY